jgi:hypothetical protein
MILSKHTSKIELLYEANIKIMKRLKVELIENSEKNAKIRLLN